MQPTSQNPYPIYDQKFYDFPYPTVFMTCPKIWYPIYDLLTTSVQKPLEPGLWPERVTSRYGSRTQLNTPNINKLFVKGFSCWSYLPCEAAGGEEGKARMEEGGHCKEVASSKWKTNSRLECKNLYPVHDQNGPFGAAHTFIAHIRKKLPPIPRDCTACLHLSPLDWSVHKKCFKFCHLNTPVTF